MQLEVTFSSTSAVRSFLCKFLSDIKLQKYASRPYTVPVTFQPRLTTFANIFDLTVYHQPNCPTVPPLDVSHWLKRPRRILPRTTQKSRTVEAAAAVSDSASVTPELQSRACNTSINQVRRHLIYSLPFFQSLHAASLLQTPTLKGGLTYRSFGFF